MCDVANLNYRYMLFVSALKNTLEEMATVHYLVPARVWKGNMRSSSCQVTDDFPAMLESEDYVLLPMTPIRTTVAFM